MKSPLKVRTYRGTITDGESLVVGAVFHHSGELIESFGSPEFRMSPRSTFKPFQAMPYILSGAFEQEGKRFDRLALACASHLGEDVHVQVLDPWMKEKNLTEDHLACGPQTGRGPSRLRNNCSGKHLGLLSAVLKLGWTVKEYNNPGSSIQTMIRKVFGDFFGEDFSVNGQGTDGCGLPVYDCQIQNLAKAWGQLLGPLDPTYNEACRDILKAMGEHPLLIEGTDSVTSGLIETSWGNIIVKGGAGGVYTGVAVKERLSFAFKCVDGQMDPTKEVLFDFLKRHKLMGLAELTAVYQKTWGPPHNWAGETTGHREITSD